MKILETKNCILRPITLNDSMDLFEYYSQDIVVKYLPLKKHKTITDTTNFIRTFFINNYLKGKIGHFGIVYKRNNKVIGNVGFNNISKNKKEGEMGICINPYYWGQNLSKELAIEMLRYGFGDLTLSKIIAYTFEDNKYSRKVLEELCFEYSGVYNKKFRAKSKTIKCRKYEMTLNSYNNKILNKKG